MIKQYFINPYSVMAPFTPADLTGLQLWLDASDSSTVLNSISPDTPATDGQTVRRWLDKSGNDLHANQATGVNQPLLDADGQNSKGVLTFDGVNDYFESGTTSSFNFLHDGTESLVVIVAKVGDSDNPDKFASYLDSGAITGSTVGYWIAYDDRSTVPRNNMLITSVRNGVTGNAVISLDADKVLPNAFHIIENAIDADNATASLRTLTKINNGVEFGSNAATQTPSTANASFPLRIARYTYDGTISATMRFAEIIICNDPNTALRSDLRNYLANKWGITLA